MSADSGRLTLCVSELIAAAQVHMDRRGDTPVGIVVEAADGKSFLHIEPATGTGCDNYELDGPWFFEVLCVAEDEES